MYFPGDAFLEFGLAEQLKLSCSFAMKNKQKRKMRVKVFPYVIPYLHPQSFLPTS